MFLSVKPPVKLDLVQGMSSIWWYYSDSWSLFCLGSGPVHIVGSQVISELPMDKV